MTEPTTSGTWIQGDVCAHPRPRFVACSAWYRVDSQMLRADSSQGPLATPVPGLISWSDDDDDDDDDGLGKGVGDDCFEEEEEEGGGEEERGGGVCP